MLIALILFAFSGQAAVQAPLILLEETRDGSRIFTYFDTADPGMIEPIELARVLDAEGLRSLGVFNGVLYLVDRDGALSGVDLGTGNPLPFTFTLPKRYKHDGAKIIIPPTGSASDVTRSLDLRGPFLRTYGTVPEEVTRKAHLVSRDGLRFLTYASEPSQGVVRELQCAIFDLDSSAGITARFTITVWNAWRLDPHPSAFVDGLAGDAVHVRPVNPIEAPVLAWAGESTIACVGLSVNFDGITWENAPDGGPALFVIDLDSRTGRVRPLSTLPVNDATGPADSQGDEMAHWNASTFGFSTSTLELLDPAAPGGVATSSARSEHLSIVRSNGPLMLLHGADPIEPRSFGELHHAVLDDSGERALLSGKNGTICYDIYVGFYAEGRSTHAPRFQDRDALYRTPVTPEEGWVPLVDTEISGARPVASARRLRSEAYTVVASSSKATYTEGEVVAVLVELTNISGEPLWTEVPAVDFPVLSGTLAGPAYATTLSEIAGLKFPPPAVPVYLGPGEKVATTFEFTPESSGSFTLALAYGGNSDAEWIGKTKAPLVRFAVGTLEADADARLRYAIQDYIDRRGNSNDRFFDELRAAGEHGEDILISMIRDIPDELQGNADSDKDHKYSSTISNLHGYLYQLRSPRLVPFFTELLGSADRDKKERGLSGIALLHAKSNKPEFRVELESILREAYADETPRAKAQIANRLRVPLFPELYEELKARADGNDPKLRDEALEVLAREYIGRLEQYAGDAEKYINIMLSDKRSAIAEHGKYCVEQLYAEKVDRPTLKRVVDEFRVRHPDQFGPNTLANWNDLWDIPWVRRAAQEPTEARFTLLQRSAEKLEKHTGISRAAEFPKRWTEFQQSDVARAAYETTLYAWEERLKANPAPFRIPVLKN